MAKKSDSGLATLAEKVLNKFRDDPFERLRLIYRQELRPFQIEWWLLMDAHPDVLVKACPRVGKTVAISLKNLDDVLMAPDENCMIFAPKHEQAVSSFETAYNVISYSDVLQAYVRRSAAGKKEFGKGFVEFENRSTINCFGVGSNFEGENASLMHVDELDDVPPDVLKRVFGRAIGKNKSGRPTRKRLSGVIWGKLNIFDFDHDPDFETLPPVNVYEALAGGFLEEKDVKATRGRMTADEWLRTMCLQYVESRNLIWSAWLKMSQFIGLHWNLMPVPPLAGATYNKKGIISFGLDMGHQGGGDDASEYSLQVVEGSGKYWRWVWGRTWPPNTDPDEIIRDITEYWAFYKPDFGFGDALDANLIAQINDKLYQEQLTYYHWRATGKNDQEGWKEWARHGLLTPIHNGGRTKHHMYATLKNAIYNSTTVGKPDHAGNVFVFPMIDARLAEELDSWRELTMVCRELENLTAEKLPSGYLKIERYRKRVDDAQLGFNGVLKLGDDRTDALAMAVAGLEFMTSRHSVGKNVGVAYVAGF